MTQVAEPGSARTDTPTPGRVSHWIGGTLVAGTSGREGPVYDPATGTLTRHVDLASVVRNALNDSEQVAPTARLNGTIDAQWTAPALAQLQLTARAQAEDVVQGIEAGADDFVAKPFDRDELRARIRAGERIVSSLQTIVDLRAQLKSALARLDQAMDP